MVQSLQEYKQIPYDSFCQQYPFLYEGMRGSVVVKTLCYMPEGGGFETRWGEWTSSIYLIRPVALGPGVHSASNRNEYQRLKKGARWIWGSHSGNYECCHPPGYRAVATCYALDSCSADFRPWRWMLYFPPKLRFTYGPHGAISQKTATFCQ
jgi:hypothetical protein